MSTSARPLSRSVRTAVAAVRAVLVLTVLLGIAYPLVVTGIAQVIFPDQSDGSRVSADGTVVGSSLIGQAYLDPDGNPLPEYFQGRPSAAGDGYDGSASGASNLGPNSADLIALIEERRAAVAELEGIDPATVPAEALTASASGLDPHISPEYAQLQVARVAQERGLTEDEVTGLVVEFTQGRVLGFLGEPRVNVLELNLALDRLER